MLVVTVVAHYVHNDMTFTFAHCVRGYARDTDLELFTPLDIARLHMWCDSRTHKSEDLALALYDLDWTEPAQHEFAGGLRISVLHNYIPN